MAPKNSVLWPAIVSQLDSRLPGWKQTIEGFGQVAAYNDRQNGKQFSDAEVFRGFVLSNLSADTDWSKIEAIKTELSVAFGDFSIDFFADLTDQYIDETLNPWFKDRRAGSMTRAQGLKRLIRLARKMQRWREHAGSVDQYLSSFVESCGGARNAVVTLSTVGEHKLKGFGIALTSEALRNIGYNLAKPDRHVLRFAGTTGLVSFPKWSQRGEYNVPSANDTKRIECMDAIAALASENRVLCTFADNAIWLLCAISGLHASNEQISRLCGDFEN
jgi:3-methyladenine DNA glycosylase Tag